MKNSLKALVVVAILAIAGMANAQNSSQATTTVNANIICPITISTSAAENLEFGTIVNGASGGTATVFADGSARSFTGSGVGAYTGSVAQATSHRATFHTGGQAGYGYAIVLSNGALPSGVTLTGLNWKTDGINLSSTSGNSGQSTLFPCEGNGGNEIDGDAYSNSADDVGCGCTTDRVRVGGTLGFTAAVNGPVSASLTMAVNYN